MADLMQTLAIGAIALIVFVNLLNPGGWIFAGLLIAAILIFYGAVEFIPEYLLVTNQGKNARKQNKRRRRRAKGLNPFSRTSGRDNGRTQQSQSNTNAGGSNDE